MSKYICVRCDICGRLGPGFELGWVDFSDYNRKIQFKAKTKGWDFSGPHDVCGKCMKALVKRPAVKSPKSHESKEFQRRVRRIKGE